MIYEWSRCTDAVFGSHIGRIPTHSKLFGVYSTMQQLQQQQLVGVFAPFSPYLIDLFIWGYLTKSANQCYTVEPRPPREDNSYWTVQLTGSADKCSWDKLDWAFPVSWGCIGGPGHFQESKGNKRNADIESLWFTLWAENFQVCKSQNYRNLLIYFRACGRSVCALIMWLFFQKTGFPAFLCSFQQKKVKNILI